MENFHSSISFDSRNYKWDIRGSIAHARMLGSQGFISPEEREEIIRGLKEIEEEIEEGKCVLEEEAEDIHMNVEKLLIEKIGDTGQKLHACISA